MPDSTWNMPASTRKGFEPIRGAWVIRRLMADGRLGFENVIHPAAIVGNLAGESGLTAIQEVSPMVPGSRGGFGWEQATGPRRVEFEAFAKAMGREVTDDEANYEFLVSELIGAEARALERLKVTTTLESAVYTFEVLFERPSSTSDVETRVRFAQQALNELGTGPAPVPATPTTPPQTPIGTPEALVEAIRMLQTILAIAGYFSGPVDGKPGETLSDAIGKYETWLDERAG
jgi:hypothetical protein